MTKEGSWENKNVDLKQLTEKIKKFFYKNWNVLKINIHRILQHMKLGGFKETQTVKKSFVGRSEN